VNIIDKGILKPMTITIFTTFDVIENQSLHINQEKSYAGNEADYPFALNTKEPVIIVDRTCNIPYDYDGLMCVPVTFMDSFNPKEFEIVAYNTKYPKDEEKQEQLKKMHEQDIQNIKKQLLLNPNNKEWQRFLQRGYSNVLLWRGVQDIYYKHKTGVIKHFKGFVIKNKPGKPLYIAPKTAPQLKNDNPLLGNKIYFYTSPLVAECICIGQTKGDVEKRVKQEFKNTPEKPYTILHYEDAVKSNGEWFRDKDFHKFLNEHGITNEIGNHSKNNEWFRVDIKTAKKLLQEYKKG